MSNRKVRKPNIVRGGTAIPLGRNYYYMSGRKHETGGIDIGKNPRTGIEVEDGEVMHVGQNEIKVFSAQPFLNGKSPAQRVMQGDNPNVVFNAQERFKKRNKLNDDGTKKKCMGGKSRNYNDNLRSKLRNTRQYRAGGLYSVTVNGVTKLYPFPSTGGVRKATTTKPAKTAKRNKYRTGGNKKENTEEVVQSITSEVNPFTSYKQIPNPTPSDNTENNISSVPRAFAKRNRNITDPEELNIAYQKSIGTYPNWFKRTYNTTKNYIRNNPNTIEDAIGLASNIGFSIAGRNSNNRALNKMRYSPQPIVQRAAKLKTRININPQLDNMRESLAAYERTIDSNTGSSQVALARKQRARIANMLQTNELFGNKENIETELINKDRLNQQEVSNKNIVAYNNWVEGKAQFENAIAMQKAENNISMINNINAGVQDIINKIQQRRSEGKNIRAMLIANPNLPVEQLLAAGLITQKEYDTYRKGYPLKGKNN